MKGPVEFYEKEKSQSKNRIKKIPLIKISFFRESKKVASNISNATTAVESMREKERRKSHRR